MPCGSFHIGRFKYQTAPSLFCPGFRTWSLFCNMFVGVSVRQKLHLRPLVRTPDTAGLPCRKSSVNVDVGNYVKLFWAAACGLTGEQSNMLYFSNCNHNPSTDSGFCFPNCSLFHTFPFSVKRQSAAWVCGGWICWAREGGLHRFNPSIYFLSSQWDFRALVNWLHLSLGSGLVPWTAACLKWGSDAPLPHIMRVHNQRARLAVNNSCQLGLLPLVMRSQGQCLECRNPSRWSRNWSLPLCSFKLTDTHLLLIAFRC